MEQDTRTLFKYQWAAPGDINAFFGLMLDNMTGLVILAGILMGVFGMPGNVVLLKMVPGTALGVMLGDFAYTWMAFRLAARERRRDVTAMPLGIDAIALFGLTFGVVGPAFLATKDAEKAWAAGMAVLVVMGGVKTITAFFGEAVRRSVPRAALLGSLGALAILFIAYMPFSKIMADPVAGFVALGTVLLTLTARVKLPFKIPGALAAVALGTAAYYVSAALGFAAPHEKMAAALSFSFPFPSARFLDGLSLGAQYLPIAIPIAISNVIGGIDNTESAAVAGDRYNTRDILLVEGVATLIAGVCGGVIQNTPYIGHPAYKRMGGRAAYTLATGIFIGAGAMAGVISWLIGVLPESVMAPILVFIGIEVCIQAFGETEKKHLPAVAFCFIPIIADLVFIQYNSLMGAGGISLSALRPDFQRTYHATMLLGNGFVCTSMLWAALLALVIDRRLAAAGGAAALGAVFTMVGLIHSPYPDGRLFLPSSGAPHEVFAVAAGYLLMGGGYFIMSLFAKPGTERESDG